MFPSGLAGAALLLLRIQVAISLVWQGTAHWTLVTSFGIALTFLVPAGSLCLGVLTPYASIFSCIIQLAAAYELRGAHGFDLSLSILSTLVVAALGPGAYSIDARLFGRKVLSLPPRR